METGKVMQSMYKKGAILPNSDFGWKPTGGDKDRTAIGRIIGPIPMNGRETPL